MTSSSIGSWDGGYVYGLDGNITMRTESGVSEDFSYDFDGDGVDESNMLTDIAGNAVEWDLNGQLVSDGQFSYIYDYDGSMLTATSLADPNLVIRYEYDPFGNRVGRVKEYAGLAEDESRYLLDYASSVPKVLMELEKDANGDWQIVRKNYYYGDMLVMSTDGSDGDRWYYFHDKLGSVRAVVDGSGAVLNNYSYTPWGADIESQTTETVRNNVRYAGYQYDNDLKQYYLWARMYSPYLARFNGYDPVRGDYKLPLTLNPYLYCLNDPVNRWDPSGRFSFGSMMAGVATGVGMTASMYGAADLGWNIGAAITGRVSMRDLGMQLVMDGMFEVAGAGVFKLGAKLMKIAATANDARKALKATKLLPKSKTVRHHIFNVWRGGNPEKKVYRDFFESRNIDINEFCIDIPEKTHQLKVHGKGNDWTAQWEKWIDANPDATNNEVYQKAGQMMDDYGLSDFEIVQWNSPRG